MKLKAQLDAIKKRHDDAIKEKQRVEAEAANARDAANAAEAARIIAGLPADVEDALQKGWKTVTLYRDLSVLTPLDLNVSGVAGHLARRLKEEGLLDRVFVDIDCSGDFCPRNAVCMRI